jgi:soluble lytic murein transglycosylase-like protein
MSPLRGALRFVATLTLGFLAVAHPAAAAENRVPDETHYATILRSINPQLQIHESLAYARSLLADSHRSHVDPTLIVALVSVESSWRPGALSPDGARGLGQLMPSTAMRLGVNPWDPRQNLRGATAYLRSLINRFAGRGIDTLRFAVGAYNSGPLAVERNGGVTGGARHYVSKVFAQWHTLNARIARTLAQAPPLVAAPPDESEWLADAGASALAEHPAAVPAP